MSQNVGYLYIVIILLLIVVALLVWQNLRFRATFKVERRISKLNARMKNSGNRLYNHLVAITKGKGLKVTRRVKDAMEVRVFNEVRSGDYYIGVSSISTGKEIFFLELFVTETPGHLDYLFISEPIDGKNPVMTLSDGTFARFDLTDPESVIVRAMAALSFAVEKYQEIPASVAA